MRKIRLGNDILISWHIYDKDGNPYSLVGKDLYVELNTDKTIVPIEDFTIVDDNVVYFTFYGKDQKVTGNYVALLSENKGVEGMKTLDTKKAFTLVAHTWQTGGGDTSQITTETLDIDGTISGTTVTEIYSYISENYYNKPEADALFGSASIAGYILYSPNKFNYETLPEIPTDGRKYYITVFNELENGTRYYEYLYTSDPEENDGEWTNKRVLTRMNKRPDEAVSGALRTESVAETEAQLGTRMSYPMPFADFGNFQGTIAEGNAFISDDETQTLLQKWHEDIELLISHNAYATNGEIFLKLAYIKYSSSEMTLVFGGVSDNYGATLELFADFFENVCSIKYIPAE